MNSGNVNPEAGGDSLPQQPDVVLVHGMWSLPETLRELHDAFVAMGYGVESLCLPHHYEKSAYNDDRKARLAAARLEEYVDHIVEKIRQKSRPPILVGHSMGALLAQFISHSHPGPKFVAVSSMEGRHGSDGSAGKLWYRQCAKSGPATAYCQKLYL